MDSEAAPAVQAVPEVTDGVTENPLWMLVPWTVFAVAAGIKFWRLTAMFRKGGLSRGTGSERFKQSLQRILASDQEVAFPKRGMHIFCTRIDCELKPTPSLDNGLLKDGKETNKSRGRKAAAIRRRLASKNLLTEFCV